MSYANDMTDRPSPPVTGTPAGSDDPVPGAHEAPVLAAELRLSLMRAVRRIRAEKADLDLSDGQLSVLAVLHARGALTNRELADFEHVRPPSMTRTVACLEERGLVARAGHPQDGRQVLVSATEAGRAMALDTRRRREAWLARQLEQLDPAERELLARAGTVLRRIADA